LSGTQVCGTCGVSKRTAKSLTWNSSGTIAEARDPEHRMVLADVEGTNELFANVEGIIGIPIQNIITESKARATQEFTKKLMVSWRGPVVRRAGLGLVVKKMAGLAKSLGYGDTKRGLTPRSLVARRKPATAVLEENGIEIVSRDDLRTSEDVTRILVELASTS